MLRARGYVFVRFSNRPDRLATVSSQHRAVPVDLLPCLQRAGWELHVPLVSDEDRMLAAFSQRARRAIRRAESEGWEIVRATADDGFDQVYGLLAETAARKGFRAPPPRETFAALVADAAPVDGVRMYLACRPDGGPASAVVAVVDGTTWHYLWGGVDAEHLRGGVSPTAGSQPS